jgi:ribose 5-phosphate isomerase A
MREKRMAGIKAADYIKDNMIVGLGTGSTVYYLIEQVGRLVKLGLNIKIVPTSKRTSSLAKKFNIPEIAIDKIKKIDLAIDGVDEIDKHFNAIKGGGGALFREKIVSTIANKVIWIMDSSKMVDTIGTFPLPVEILPYGFTHIIKKLEVLSFNPTLRMNSDIPYMTDNNNYIVDLHLGKSFDIEYVSKKLKSISGVLETGLFLNACDKIIVGIGDETRVIENKEKGT